MSRENFEILVVNDKIFDVLKTNYNSEFVADNFFLKLEVVFKIKVLDSIQEFVFGVAFLMLKSSTLNLAILNYRISKFQLQIQLFMTWI